MRLKRLELQGFKSFADKTSFDFDQGVTAFVGPNGCGKSNVVDAVRWILGEQSAKAVRGASMIDVIFNGTAARRSMGFAEASLTIENNKGRLPSEYTEVCITRRLYRSGESEYYLNRQACRLRDIRQLFMDTGVGTHTYSIIEQGKVDRFIQANAKERRMLLEEAAGISSYKAKRKEAQNRLVRAHLNLEKVEIELEGQRRMLRSIKRQAAKARRYRRHSARLRHLEVSLSARNYRAWEAERLKLEEAITVLTRREASLAAEVEQMEAGVQAADGEIALVEGAHRDTRDELHGVTARIEAGETAIHNHRQRISEYEDETANGRAMVAQLSDKLRQTRESMDGAIENLEQIRETIARQAEIIAQETARADAASGQCAELSTRIDDWKVRMVEVLEHATTLHNELNHMERSQREQLARRARLAGSLQAKEQESETIEGEVGRLAGQRDALSDRLADHASTLRKKESELNDLTARSQKVDEALRALHHREGQNLSRREILQDIEVRSEDVEVGVKRLLREDDGDIACPEILGMVADLVRADLEFAAAIESALGEAAQYLVTRDEHAAGAAAALLRTDQAGRAGLIPLSRARAPQQTAMHLHDEETVIGRAQEFVRYEPWMEPAVRYLLGNTWIVKDLATAMRLAGNGGSEMRFVTVDGERVEPAGAIVGGEPLPRIGIVSRKSELEAIEADLVAINGEVGKLESERGRFGQVMESLQTETGSLRKEIEQGNLEKVSNEGEILNLRQRQRILADESSVLRMEVAEIDAVLQSYEQRRVDIEREAEETARQQEGLQAEVARAGRELDEQKEVAARLRDEVTHLRVELGRKEAQRGSLEETIQAAKQTLADLEGQIAGVQARVKEIEQRQTASEEAIQRAQDEVGELTQQRAGVESRIEELAQELIVARQHRASCVEKTRAARANQDEVRQDLHEKQMQEQERRVHIEELVERVFADYGIQMQEFVAGGMQMPETDMTPDETGKLPDLTLPLLATPEGDAPSEGEAASAPVEQDAHAPDPETVDWKAVHEEIADLRERIRRIGGVDEEAIDQEESLELTISQTEAQREDLDKAEAHLREVIRKLNRVCRERFTTTFEEVRVNFNDMFRRLFGGGTADLVLDADDPEPLEAGIDVMCTPPGKDLQSITLMSGGEKTMTTIALLFAIFKSKPSPFCILDEVDAALDENNIDRFTNMLGEFLNDSQFIVITHSKRTLGIADSMYGITMEEKGVSKNVAVSLEGTEAQNN